MQAGTVNMKLMADIMDVQKKFSAMEKMADSTVNKIGGAFSGLGVKIAAALSVGAVVAWVKSGLDAADAMSKLAQSTGVAVKDVGGLQLAFRQSGLGAGELSASMRKLNQGIAEGSKGLELMGVNTRNADGSLKSAREVLGSVADQFARYEDGAAKAALAQQIFGKSGAELIPLLNGGSQALDDFDAMAAKLGLTMDEGTARAAEKFNDTIDLMGQGVKGMGMQVAAQLLPTLQTLADKLFGAMTAGDRMANVTKVLSVALKLLGSAAIVLIEIVSMLSRSFSTFATMARQALTGDFAGAMETYKNGMVANFKGVRESLNSIGELWTETGNTTVEAVASANKAMQQQPPIVREAAKATFKLTGEQKRLNAELDEFFKMEEAQRLAKEKSIQGAREMVEAIEFETAALKMTNTEREIAIKLRELERAGMKQGSAEYEIYAKRIREAVAGREAVRASVDAQRKAREDWAKTWDQVAQSFTDALMQGGQSVKEYLQSLFRTMVLRPLLQPIIAGGSSMMAGVANAFGFGPESAGGVGSTMNLVSSIRSAYQAISGGFTALGNTVAFAADSMGAWLVNNTSGVLNQMGGSLMQSAGTLGTAASYLGGAAAGLALGTVISNGYSAIGKSGNTAVVAGTAIGAIFGGPLGAAIGGAIGGAFNRAFGRKAPQTTGTGITGTFSTDGANMRQYEEWFSKGGWFRSNKSGVNYSAISSELDQFLDGSLIQITQATRMYAQILGLNADAVNGVTQSVTISLMGLSAEKQQEKIMQALGGFSDELAKRLLGEFVTVTTATESKIAKLFGGLFGGALGKAFSGNAIAEVFARAFGTTTTTTTTWIAGPFVRAGETAGEALSRLANSLVTVNQVFDTLNQTLMHASLAGGDAASALLDIFGGTEEFTKATTAYYQAFYTTQERLDTTTRQLTEVFGAMGLTLPKTREEYRALVEAQDLYTEAGRQTYAALLNLAPTFASITEAVQQLSSSVQNEVRRLRGMLTTDSPQAMAALQAQFLTLTAQARAGDVDARERLPQLSQALEKAAMLSATTAVDVARMRAWLANSMSDTMAALGMSVPQFAVGTNYVPRDMLAMVHQGEAIVPKAYNPAAGGGEVADEIRALRQEVAMLRYEAQATATHTNKTARILDRVTRDGESLLVTEAQP